jgi:hypothetical protein
MGISKRIGYLGFGGVVGAAVILPAAAANAGTTYNSTATATAGAVSVGGNALPVPDNTVTATDGNSPQHAGLGLGTLENALPGTPLGTSLTTAVPAGANLVTETATASADGKSSASAGLLSGNDGQPITLSLSLADLPGLNLPSPGTSGQKPGSTPAGGGTKSPLSGLLPSGLPTSLPTSLPSLPLVGGKGSSAPMSGSARSAGTPDLTGYSLVLTLSGPRASCTAGPAGGPASDFTASQSLATAGVSIDDNGKPVVSSAQLVGPVDNLLSQVPVPSSSALSGLLGESGILTASPIKLTINPGSTSGAGAGPVTTATAGEIALSVQGTPVLDVIGAKATCGANKPAATTTTSTTGTAPERPLGGGIQTDEGRSGSSGLALWLGAAGGAVLAGGAGGMLWRRRGHGA